MKPWRTWDMDYLEAHAGDGASVVAAHLGRTEAAVRSQAARWGISLGRRWTCPHCGATVHQPLSGRTGWCRECTVADTRDRAAENNRRAREMERESAARCKAIEDERQALYTDTSRRKARMRGRQA